MRTIRPARPLAVSCFVLLLVGAAADADVGRLETGGFTVEPVGEDSTRLHLSVRAVGEENEKWGSVVDQVWHHFLFERFVPYVNGGFRPLD